MTTPTTIEALESAIGLLKMIAEGKQPSGDVISLEIEAFQEAANEHRRLEMIDQRNRAAICELATRRRYR